MRAGVGFRLKSDEDEERCFEQRPQVSSQPLFLMLGPLCDSW
jgi:hypothetical protein